MGRSRRTRPTSAPPPRAAVDDELLGALGDLRVEVVHQHGSAASCTTRGMSSRCPGRRARSARSLEPRSLPRRPRSAPRRPRAARPPSVRARNIVGSRAGNLRSQRRERGGGAGPGSSGAAFSALAPRAPARRPDPAEVRQGRAQLAGRSPRHRQWSSCIALVGTESTLDGAARRRFLGDIAACMYSASISPELTPGPRPGTAAGRRAARVEPPIRPALGNRATSAAAIATKSQAKPSGAPWKFPHDSTRPSEGSSSCRSPRPARPLPPRKRPPTVSRAAPWTWGAQRSEYASWTRGSFSLSLATIGEPRGAGRRFAAPAPVPAAAAARAGPRRRPDRCRGAPRPTSPP